MADQPQQHAPLSSQSKKAAINWVHLILIVLLLLGFSLRIAGLTRGPHYRNHDPNQPFWSHADEYLQTEYAARIANYDFAWGDTSYIKPGVATKYPLAILMLLLNILTPIPITSFFVLKASQFISVILGTLGIITVYLLGRDLYSRRAGLFAAALFTVTMFHIKLSHYATPYPFFIIMWVLVVLYTYRFCFPRQEHGQEGETEKHETLHDGLESLKEYSLSSIIKHARQGKIKIHKQLFLIGLFWMFAIASSYLSLFLLIPIALAFSMKWGVFSWLIKKRAATPTNLPSFLSLSFISFTNIAIGIFIGTLLVFPHLYLDTKHVLQNFFWIFQEGSQGLYGLTATKGLGFFGLQMQSFSQQWWGIGTAMFLAGAAALAFFLYRRRKSDILIMATILLYSFYMGTKHLNLLRYHSVLYPFIAVMIGALFDAALGWWKEKAFSKIWKGVVMIAFAGVFLFSMLYSLMYVSILTDPDTRDVSGRWMDQNLPPGTPILVGPGGTQPWMLPVTDYAKYPQSSSPEYILIVESVFLPIQRYLYDEIYQDSDWGTKLPAPQELAFYDQLFKGNLPYTLAATFENKPHAFGLSFDDTNAPYELWGMDYPEIRIYKRIPLIPGETGVSPS